MCVLGTDASDLKYFQFTAHLTHGGRATDARAPMPLPQVWAIEEVFEQNSWSPTLNRFITKEEGGISYSFQEVKRNSNI